MEEKNTFKKFKFWKKINVNEIFCCYFIIFFRHFLRAAARHSCCLAGLGSARLQIEADEGCTKPPTSDCSLVMCCVTGTPPE